MIFLSRYLAAPICLALLAVINVSFAWCPEAGCSSGESGDRCAEVACAAAAGHSDDCAQTAAPGAGCCSCTSQLPSFFSPPISLDLMTICEALALESDARLLFSPTPSIFRPPVS